MKTERLPVCVLETAEEAAAAVAQRIADVIRAKASAGKQAVLGLATGSTPINVYRRLIQMHRQGLRFTNVVTFNLDEYWPMPSDALRSYHHWMHENFFHHVDIPSSQVHIPDGTIASQHVDEHCRKYEQAIEQAGGIDIQILGIGRTGHIGFNEPGTTIESRTRLVYLDKITRMDAASDFFGEENVPRQAITMGIATILAAREICLLAFGEHKAPVVRQAVEEEATNTVAASYLQTHPATTVFLDASAAAMLTRRATPWLVQQCQWNPKLTRKAVIWLATKTGKAILSLTDEDYAANHLHDLLITTGGAYNANLEVFRTMMNTITGWPAGRDIPRTVLVFSPHPDDDVISMGATLQRLCQQGHRVHTAYQTSGNISVFDHNVLRFADFVREFNSIFGLAAEATDVIDSHIEQFLRHKEAGAVDSLEVQAVKTLIRRTEAISAAGFCGVARENCHFLEMPFYQTGEVRKLPIGRRDVEIVLELLQKVRPDILFAAGDLSDPHGTHRMCMEALMKALGEYNRAAPQPPVVWLYRGAWQEWEPHEIDMAVPVSPDELYHKRHAIFRHESQKDRAMFPGPYDSREFWQRAEDRNRNTAAIYDKLGLPQYNAVEAFVLACPPGRPTS
jgi:glucosamine-6-phosphate deaminase